ncbi:hypothetical protein [Barnesiella sp. CU968]|jgi:hypothetical protein|uniref:hypothetical protein n=1 Tax=Barnesiella sp. CU968 TaxID=2780099 RepID=UPI00195B6494|nr:hypothetical protein [Barnesiella sp. CU968]MCI9029788.1 hypothetical protein [Muribaculaceae bacterium]
MEEQYRKEIAWWFAELGSESEVDNYLALFPELNSPVTDSVILSLLLKSVLKIKSFQSHQGGIHVLEIQVTSLPNTS